MNKLELLSLKGHYINPFEEMYLCACCADKIEYILDARRCERKWEFANRYKLLIICLCTMYIKRNINLKVNKEDNESDSLFVSKLIDFTKSDKASGMTVKIVTDNSSQEQGSESSQKYDNDEAINTELGLACVHHAYNKFILSCIDEEYNHVLNIKTKKDFDYYSKILLMCDYDRCFIEPINWDDKELIVRIDNLYEFFDKYFNVILQSNSYRPDLKN